MVKITILTALFGVFCIGNATEHLPLNAGNTWVYCCRCWYGPGDPDNADSCIQTITLTHFIPGSDTNAFIFSIRDSGFSRCFDSVTREYIRMPFDSISIATVSESEGIFTTETEPTNHVIYNDLDTSGVLSYAHYLEDGSGSATIYKEQYWNNGMNMWNGRTVRYISCNRFGLMHSLEWWCFRLGEEFTETILLSFNGDPVYLPNDLVVGSTMQAFERKTTTKEKSAMAVKRTFFSPPSVSAVSPCFHLNGQICRHASAGNCLLFLRKNERQ
ncbi:MAG: hypothetical protein JW863_21865 [Chitinispirillaceae bacterium]|nr:hypothetical protein [Chitinispirillaceae bacterium]